MTNVTSDDKRVAGESDSSPDKDGGSGMSTALIAIVVLAGAALLAYQLFLCSTCYAH